MSSDPQIDQAPFEDSTRYLLGLIGKGVIIVITRTTLAATIGLTAALLVPALGMAEEPQVMEEVQVQLDIEQAALPEDEQGGLKDWGAGVLRKAGAGLVKARDAIVDKDEREKKLEAKLHEKDDMIQQLTVELAEQRKATAAARYDVGVNHEMMMQCSKDLVEYISNLQTD